MTTQDTNNIITTDIILAYSHCPRKAFLLLYFNKKVIRNEYVKIIERQKEVNQKEYINTLKQKHPNVKSYSIRNFKSGGDFLINATLKNDQFEANCDILTKIDETSSLGNYSYEPSIFTGTHKISKDQKLELFVVGYVLEQMQGKFPLAGRIISMGPKTHRIGLKKNCMTLIPLIESFKEFFKNISSNSPPVILNQHCLYCQFRKSCKTKAEEEDNLSLLERMTTKKIQRYEKKGIFTVNQLSYLYKPRRRKKRVTKPLPAIHNLELQALAIRSGKVYLKALPEIFREPIELFLDIEGIPDEEFYYLIGLLVCDANNAEYYYFWANTRQDESEIWQQFLEKIAQYPDVPIYHYGSYEHRALAKMSKRYETKKESFKNSLVNINTYIFGKVYFPLRSNRLKDIGNFIGATWSSQVSSGLESLICRNHWDRTFKAKYKNQLITYNKEDCQAIKLLIDELFKIQLQTDSLPHVDFPDQSKRHVTETAAQLHEEFEIILKTAHADYDKKKISLQGIKKKQIGEKRKRGAQKGHLAYHRVIPKARKVIQLRRRRKCYRHKGVTLQASEEMAERTIIDLAFQKNGVKKTITKYVGTKSYCPKCKQLYNPIGINKLGNQIFGHAFQAWVIYQRLVLRLPYRIIVQVLIDQFHEKISPGTIVNFLRYFSNYYSDTEKIIIQNILTSPFIHVDETKINILGVDHFVWVFTDGQHVFFKHTKTREAKIVHKILTDYTGIIITDFYGGYDAVKCRQQKCWSHLLGDINDDLWEAPFDREFENFALEVKNLILPILQAIEKYGLKRKHLIKFLKTVERFYKNAVISRYYKAELTNKYQKRFIRYRNSLFTFLEYDGISWNNNLAERALRHLAVQRKISGTFFDSLVEQYLLLLGIMQTCRFQEKSLLGFLLSGEKDIDKFKKSKLIKSSHTVRKK